MSDIALFSAPIEGEVVQSGMPILILGLTDDGDVLSVDEDGGFIFHGFQAVRTTWRYDWRKHDWVDLKETDATQDSPLDGGEGVSGSVPESDDIGESDPFDPEGRQTTGDPGNLDTGEAQ